MFSLHFLFFFFFFLFCFVLFCFVLFCCFWFLYILSVSASFAKYSELAQINLITIHRKYMANFNQSYGLDALQCTCRFDAGERCCSNGLMDVSLVLVLKFRSSSVLGQSSRNNMLCTTFTAFYFPQTTYFLKAFFFSFLLQHYFVFQYPLRDHLQFSPISIAYNVDIL